MHTRSYAANQALGFTATINRRFWEEFPSRVRRKKGPDLSIRAMPPCADGYLSVMVLVFDPPSTGELENTVTEVGLLTHTVASVGSDGPPGLSTRS